MIYFDFNFFHIIMFNIKNQTVNIMPEIDSKLSPDFFKEKLEQSLTYQQYKDMVLTLAENKGTTGNDKSQSRIDNTKLSAVRMNRIDKTDSLNPETTAAFKELKKEYLWLVLTESWCGDSAQNIPYINMIAEISDNIELRFLFRDDNPELMDCCLTKGTRSIPKLIAIDKQNFTPIGLWGPRPAPAQNMMMEYKGKKHKEYADVQKDIAIWYTKDKGATIQIEFISLINEWENS